MNTQEIKELTNRPAAELQAVLKDARERLRVLRFDLAAGKVKNVNELRTTRKDIARILTVLKQKHGAR